MFIVYCHITTGGPFRQMNLLSMIDRIVSGLYPGHDSECTIVASASMDRHLFKEYFQPEQERHAAITVTEDHLAAHKDMLSDFLKMHTGCAVAAYEGGSSHMKDMILALRKVKTNFLVKLDGPSPKKRDMISSDYPILWTQESFEHKGKLKTILGLFCPKEDKSKSITIRTRLTENSEIRCPHYLDGQKLGLGHLYKNVRRIINGKTVFGDNYVRFFEFASKKFKFDPWFKLGRIIYFPKNESWGGIQKEVT